ncbi:hypothetical protein TRIUR3_30767 [Triticum urartu]|uniref:Uncharacterized protein n=1 Tax=Triticum urartu TaxID=4572 RepID=M8A1I3_TRIUA|nr:hypothetical protein TRIUR3_30767 [Triticum urartu]
MASTAGVVLSIKDSFLALPTKTGDRKMRLESIRPCLLQLFLDHTTESKMLRSKEEKKSYIFLALEEVEKNISSLRQVLSGDGEAGANQEQVLQIALEICKEGVLSLFVQNLPSLGWGMGWSEYYSGTELASSELQKVDENYCCVKYIEDHVELLDFLVVWQVIYFSS